MKANHWRIFMLHIQRNGLFCNNQLLYDDKTHKWQNAQMYHVCITSTRACCIPMVTQKVIESVCMYTTIKVKKAIHHDCVNVIRQTAQKRTVNRACSIIKLYCICAAAWWIYVVSGEILWRTLGYPRFCEHMHVTMFLGPHFSQKPSKYYISLHLYIPPE